MCCAGQMNLMGGVLYIESWKNEAQRQRYDGFHQYNIDIQDGCLIIYNKNTRVNINELLGNTASISYHEDGDIVYITITKLADASHLLTKNNDCRLLSTQLMYCMQRIANVKRNPMYYIQKLKSGLYVYITQKMKKA